MVPKGWELTTFEKHINLLSGFAFKSAQYTENQADIRLLRGDNIAPNTLRWGGVKTWNKSEYHDLEKYHLQEYDFVIAMDRTWVSSGLKVAEVTKEDLPCLLVQRVARIRALPNLEQSLLRQYFSSHRFEQYVKGVQTETAVPHISATQIKEFTLLLPPLPEQRKIAKILSTWDKAIATTEKLIASSKQQKKALMQQLLTGKKRLFSSPKDGAETGVAFEGEWDHGVLGDICSFKGGSAFKEIYQGQKQGDYPFIKVSDMNTPNNHKFIFKANNWVTVETAQLIKATVFDKGAVVFAKVGAALLLNRRRILSRPTIVDNNMMAAIPNQLCSTNFLYQLMLMIDFAEFVQGGAVPSINQSDLSKFKISYPVKSEQQKIASVLTAADKEIELLNAKLSHFKQEKKALMQQLLTGKRRVKVDQDQTPTPLLLTGKCRVKTEQMELIN